MLTEIYYFTGTGNSLSVCKSLKKFLGTNPDEKVKLIPIGDLDLNRIVNSNGDRIGIVYPTYDFNAPRIVKNFSKQLRIATNSYVFTYVTSAGGFGNSIATIKSILNKNNINMNNAFRVALPDNSILSEINTITMSKQLNVAENQHIIDFSQIKDMYSDPNKNIMKARFTYAVLSKFFDFFFSNIIVFKDIKVSESCNGCSTCSKVCPVSNIELIESKPIFNNKCEMCLSCIHNCPKQALKYKRMPKRENFQYRHPDIKLSDLIRNPK